MPDYTASIYPIALVMILALYGLYRSRKQKRSVAIRDTAIAEGLTEPASLHPIINPGLCIGCQACIDACPEHDVLGLIGGKAALINPTHCIGHGACKDACPTQSITLVFGTATRGLDIPVVSPSFETNVPGVFIAGELGGMGLIRNAVTQGAQAIDNIRMRNNNIAAPRENGALDVVIVGAGPAGFAGSLAAMKHKLDYVTVEQETLGGTVAHYPRGKIVMTQPMELPLYGKVKLRETTKEKLLALWESVEAKTGVKINYQERVESVAASEHGFEVTTTKAVYQTRNVLLTLGRRGTPRTLGVPGEGQNKVVYRLIDPEQYRGQNVLVVGGGDSALEAAWSIAAEQGAKVTLSYRREAFDRAKAQNRNKVKAAQEEGSLDVLFKSSVKAIGEKHVEIVHNDQTLEVANDAVIVCAGGILPNAFLKSIGITIETKYGTA